ncbi:MAG: choice-of-anchor Q domain-containing protein, partial [Candidatus Cloacimonadota bacterium]|nr:choice-of-anchor Q domain-containing protein [Candidatus Cloacimonadota bacterium]
KPDGDNSNTGLNWDTAYRNIYYALIMIKSDSLHPNTINVAEGFYSPSTTGEFFALGGKEYISIIGAGKNETILDAEQTSKLFTIKGVSNFFLQELRLQHGYSSIGGISMSSNSSPHFKDICLIDNNGDFVSHVNCYQNNSIFENVIIKTNYEQVNAKAVECGNQSNPVFINCTIEGNKTNPQYGHFGANVNGNLCYPVFINCNIIDNYGDIASGIRQGGGHIYLINCTICDNDHCSQGTISLVFDAHITLINTILRNEPATEIWFHPSYDPNSATLEYCNIEGGSLAVAINNNGTLNWGEGNIDEDPMFVGGDPFSYELLPGSPCIDAGNPDTTGLNLPELDLAGKPRIYNGRIDIGAYEWQGQGIDEPDTSFINKLYLFQNTPNPFKDKTEILFITADYERVKDYTLSIYNVKGQLVRKYSGRNHNFWVKTDIVWDGTDEDGNKVSPGVYFYKLIYGDNSVTKKMILVR